VNNHKVQHTNFGHYHHQLKDFLLERVNVVDFQVANNTKGGIPIVKTRHTRVVQNCVIKTKSRKNKDTFSPMEHHYDPLLQYL
jgi:hypothetical protein